MAPIFHRFAQVNGTNVFYRESGDPHHPTVLLLHGFPTSSFMYRNLIPLLAERFHVIAPDLPGFGLTECAKDHPSPITFDWMAHTIAAFTEVVGLKTFALQVFDYGAPVGWRVAATYPDKIAAIVTQNGNAYEEGLSTGWNPIQAYWREPSHDNREALRSFLTLDAIRWQYTQGVPDPSLVSPDGPNLDFAQVSRLGNDEVQLDLFLDYATNVARYPAFHEYFQKYQPPLLAVWGQNDPFFLPAGAEAFKRDLPNAEIHFFDTGHFALETHVDDIGAEILRFLDRTLS